MDLFELSIKRGLEHHEMPLDKNAWKAFEGNLTGAQGAPTAGGASSSFLSKFGLAAAVLTGAVVFINYTSSADEHIAGHTDAKNHAIEHVAEGVSAIAADNNTDASTTADSAVIIDADHNATSEADLKSADLAAATAAENALAIQAKKSVTKAEAERLERINEKLQAAAEGDSDKKPDDLEKRLTTRYVGTAFNLGAVKSFTPNNDGNGDYFLPSKIEANDIFELKITGPDGSQIFKSVSTSNPWLGRDTLGNKVPEGRYAWEVILQGDESVNKEIFRGTVRLER